MLQELRTSPNWYLTQKMTAKIDILCVKVPKYLFSHLLCGKITILPPMLSGEELCAAMTILPDYDEAIRQASVTDRLIALSELYRVYVPSQMSVEVYSKIYLALLRSLQKKESKMVVKQRNQNARGCHGGIYEGIIGGSDIHFNIICIWILFYVL